MEYSIENILVPTDFSESADNALTIAIAVAERHNATLHLLHVIEPLILGKFANIHGKIINVQKKMILKAKKNIAYQANLIEKSTTLKVKANVFLDGVADGVARYEDENNISLTVIGTHGKSGYYDFFSGSNAIRIIEKSNVPVLSISPFFTKKVFEKILYPVRVVEGNVEKYEYVKPILQKNKSKLQILGVYEFEKVDQVNELSEKIDEIRYLAQSNDSEVSYDLTPCHGIEKIILEKSEEFQSDLIVINTTFDKKWYHIFKGNSFTEEIVNKAKIPILNIKSKLLINDLENLLDLRTEKNIDYMPLNIHAL